MQDTYSDANFSKEYWEARARKLEDEGKIPIRGRAGGVVYLYREYVHRAGDPLAEYNEPTDHYIEQRWTMGKAPDRQVWDYGRTELRRAYTAPGVSFKGSGFAANS